MCIRDSVNGGNVKNTGIEVGLHWNDNIGKDFQYGANLTLAHNKNEVTKICLLYTSHHIPKSLPYGWCVHNYYRYHPRP